MSLRTIKIALAAALSVLTLSVAASPASAEIVEAGFSSPSVRLTTTGVMIKKNGGSAKSCSATSIELATEEESFIGSNDYNTGGVRFRCSDGSSLLMAFWGYAYCDTVAQKYFMSVSDHGGQALESPWGWYFQSTGETDNWTWVNGSGGTPSTITLKDQWVGSTVSGNEKVTISGTFTAKAPSGGAVTLSH